MAEPPFLTAGLAGTGGRLKEEPDDFQVEELPAYPPSGQGEHLYLWVEKVDRDTAWVAAALARALEIPEPEVGYAGLKDRRARTWQTFSVPARAQGKVATINLPGVTVHRAVRHGNKLRSGHLAGNRFRIRIRAPRDPKAAEPILEALTRQGVPNFFGEQRFGRDDDNAVFGKRLLLGQRLPKKPSRFQRKLYLSAYQSLLFNRALSARLAQGTLGRVLLGDVLRKTESGGLFVCEDPAVDQPRADAWELSPAGPLFGPKMVAAQGEVAQAEARLLEEEGISPAAFEAGRGETEGARRPYRVRLEEARAWPEGEDLWVGFTLPKGSYATVVLGELMKSAVA